MRRITVDRFDGHVDDREGGRIDAGWDVVDAVGAQRPERDELGHGRIDQPQLQVPVVGIEPFGLQSHLERSVAIDQLGATRPAVTEPLELDRGDHRGVVASPR